MSGAPYGRMAVLWIMTESDHWRVELLSKKAENLPGGCALCLERLGCEASCMQHELGKAR